MGEPTMQEIIYWQVRLDLEREYHEARMAKLKEPDTIAELEAERDQLLDKICADRDFHAKNRAERTALVDGLRELPRYTYDGVNDKFIRVRNKPGGLIFGKDMDALLGTINNPDSDSKVSTLLDKESGDE